MFQSEMVKNIPDYCRTENLHYPISVFAKASRVGVCTYNNSIMYMATPTLLALQKPRWGSAVLYIM